jgi:hypothetical protein
MTNSDKERAITCRLDRKLKMFKVLKSRGNALGSGGFGVSIEFLSQSQANSEDENDERNTESSKTSTFLFPEEAIFLHQRCYIHCYDEVDEDNENDKNDPKILDTSQLLRILPDLGMSIPMYLVYCHLRNQDFRILRHHPDRLSILKRQQHAGVTTSLRRQVRMTIQSAPAPTIAEMNQEIHISWDAYKPSSDFAKTHPGPPDFYVAVTYYNQPFINFQQLLQLLRSKANGIPLKVATVSDSGTVNMFGVTSDGIPDISK